MTSPSPAPDATPHWSRYVAIGDSFSEGLWDPYPRTDGTPVTPGTESEGVQRGWADRLADHLAERRGDAPFEYANLAIRGRKLRQIVTEQVSSALAMEPDLVSLVGGGNDILRPHADVHALSTVLERAVAQIRGTGADVLLATGFRTEGALNWTQGRVGVYNANIWSIARRHGAHVLDTWGLHSLQDWRMWSDDRIHLTDEGHRRIANAALVGLGLAPDDPAYDDPLDAAPSVRLRQRLREDAQWARTHVAPWVRRRITGTSSGDGRPAKWTEPKAWPPSER
ncbi:SGNH/GDSL hydrolase family protein [Isoptericola halotolerans]|uniref:Lysophospholipase L1-like esterase n=1 Tax=Isoptericola halotolerans TaxID=300560 RepID=A0ABX2A3G3_9MICO|nr:lysophospholipase L1-like esterase [Isoptericola halotolerans]